ncbi:GntR family transcriptional regulator [Pseudoruegeria sp. SHC-113]|uniref:GntR family transcriptional regulator n=1 Tax=Pseudoruegeria sp. SHC-113 TaxID=2855439 RepID=UPI0021BB696F|nr:GntR family transcriptional regulator [Pseudoruegeria sp. SHC-113]MCT8161596.1 GntR family transcriptional regulator [Pseudoruegeria sp. SHC-113]
MVKSADTAAIYSDLQDKLINGYFGAAAKLKPGTLQGAYGCSANTIRDVLLRLSSMGLVTFELQRGFRTQPCSQSIRADVTRFRIMLEQEGAARSMKLGGVAWEAQLTAAHHKLVHIETRIARESGAPGEDSALWSSAEYDFHRTLISACDSPILLHSFDSIYLQFRQQMFALERDFGGDYFRAIIGEHQTILDAALGRDEAACRKAIHDHLKRNL